MYKNPFPTVDCICVHNSKILLIERKNEPKGWALPGGFVDYGESTENACLREIKEECGIELNKINLFNVYSEPDRDPRQHNISIVYYSIINDRNELKGLKAADDAKNIIFVSPSKIKEMKIAFDHKKIISEFVKKYLVNFYN